MELPRINLLKKSASATQAQINDLNESIAQTTKNVQKLASVLSSELTQMRREVPHYDGELAEIKQALAARDEHSVSDLVADRFAQISEQIASDRALVSNTLDTFTTELKKLMDQTALANKELAELRTQALKNEQQFLHRLADLELALEQAKEHLTQQLLAQEKLRQEPKQSVVAQKPIE